MSSREHRDDHEVGQPSTDEAPSESDGAHPVFRREWLQQAALAQRLKLEAEALERALLDPNLPKEERRWCFARVEAALPTLMGVTNDMARARVVAVAVKFVGQTLGPDLASAVPAGSDEDDARERRRVRRFEAAAMQAVIDEVERYDESTAQLLTQQQARDEVKGRSLLLEAVRSVAYSPWQAKPAGGKRNEAIARLLEALGLPSSERTIKGTPRL